MSLKKFVKKNCPECLFPLLRAGYRTLKFPYTLMHKRNIIARADKLRPYYRDELSLLILSDREKYLLNPDENIFIDRAVKQGWKFYPSYNHSNILIIYDDKDNKDFDYTIKFLQISGLSDKSRTLTLDEFMKDYNILEDDLIVTAMSKKGLAKFLSYACKRNLFYKHYIYTHKLTSIREDIQYFDVFDPVDDEIIIDAGCFNGATAKQFLEWGGDKVKKIYSLI